MFDCNLKGRSGPIALVLALVLVGVSSNPIDSSNEAEALIKAPDGIANKLFGWMPSFEQFKTMYHKNYKSALEEMRRKSILIANELRAWVSQVNFRQKRSTCFMITSGRSDMTDEELDSTMLSREERHKKYSEFLMSEVEVPEDNVEAAGWLTKIKNLPTRALDGVMPSVYDKLDGKLNSAFASIFRDLKYRPDLPDEVFIDHRQGDTCLGGPRHQGTCGSCYILSTIALYEWAYCKQKKSLIPFSEQYILDCGHLTGLKVCEGGFEPDVAKFIRLYGFELQDEYDYSLKPKPCPSTAKKIESNKMGRIRLDRPSLSFVWPNKIDEELKQGPLITSITISNSFYHYGGGLDDGNGCESNRRVLHSVLLVGSGRQDGHEYWIIRNSHGRGWGELGDYRLRKDSNCFLEFTAYKLKARTNGDKDPKDRFYDNPEYNG